MCYKCWKFILLYYYYYFYFFVLYILFNSYTHLFCKIIQIICHKKKSQLKPSSSLELNHRIASTRTGGQPPARPPPPMVHSLQSTPLRSHNQSGVLPPSYYNHPYVTTQQQHKQQQKQQQHTKHSHSLSPAQVETQPQSSVSHSTQFPTNGTNSYSSASVKLATSTPNNKIIATETIFDNPPDMISPPVPPRRFGNGGGTSNVVVAAGIKKLQRNCWHAASEAKYVSKNCNVIELRNSSSSNSSTASALSCSTSASSSDHSFVSAASTFSHHQPLCNELAAATTGVPVPAPRLKKEVHSSLSWRAERRQYYRPHKNLLL